MIGITAAIFGITAAIFGIPGKLPTPTQQPTHPHWGEGEGGGALLNDSLVYSLLWLDWSHNVADQLLTVDNVKPMSNVCTMPRLCYAELCYAMLFSVNLFFDDCDIEDTIDLSGVAFQKRQSCLKVFRPLRLLRLLNLLLLLLLFPFLPSFLFVSRIQRLLLLLLLLLLLRPHGERLRENE